MPCREKQPMPIRAIAIATILLFCAQGVSFAQQKNDGEGFKYSVQSQLVEIFLTVTEGKQLVPNLTAPDFTISEDGAPVPVDRLDNPDVPLQIVLLVDLSESVRPALKTIQDAAIAFLDSLNPRDRVMLLLFNSEIRFFEQRTEDRSTLIREIRNARAIGMTKLYEAMLSGMKYLQGKTGRKAMVCFTDGQDTSETASANAVMYAAARSGYPIYMIGAGAGLELASLKILLRGFAEINGGKAFFIQSISKLKNAFAEVAAELRAAYVLNYYTQAATDGQWHEFIVSTNNPAYTVHTRKGFYARRE
jgi:VWFA-related protein